MKFKRLGAPCFEAFQLGMRRILGKNHSYEAGLLIGVLAFPGRLGFE